MPTERWQVFHLCGFDQLSVDDRLRDTLLSWLGVQNQQDSLLIFQKINWYVEVGLQASLWLEFGGISSKRKGTEIVRSSRKKEKASLGSEKLKIDGITKKSKRKNDDWNKANARRKRKEEHKDSLI